jgi:Cu(I)/Ag(I) efflux system membrane protein CusA/SilA
MAVLLTFIAMKYFRVDANIVALSGIAIAIGTMVDMGIVITENIIKHLESADPGESRLGVIFRASSEVGVATTVVSFLPVFTMEAAEGKLFKPLAFTKTFALIASILVALTIIPPFAQILFTAKIRSATLKRALHSGLILTGLVLMFALSRWIGLLLILIGAYHFFESRVPEFIKMHIQTIINIVAVFVVAILLAGHWLPLGPEKGLVLNFSFVALLIGGLLLVFYVFQQYYSRMLKWTLDHKLFFMGITLTVTLLGGLTWLGFNAFFGWLPEPVKKFRPVSYVAHKFPGLGKEFMPPLDEGSYLYMPTTMPHASIGEVIDVLSKQDMSFNNLPEIESAVGKLGRADTPLDPAPISMIETVINYKPEYLIDRGGERLTFKFNPDEDDYFRDENGVPVASPDGEPYMVNGEFERDENGKLIPDPDGAPFRLWRPPLDPDLNPEREVWPGIKNPGDIWDEIVKAGQIPGTTSAPRLQPIAARIVMLQSGMRAPMGVKVKGPDLESIEKVGLEIEQFLKEVPSINPEMVIADRIIGKPYLEIEIDRNAIARYGIMLQQVQEVIEVAIGGKRITSTVEGRERYPVRVRYMRELRNTIETLERILVPAPGGAQIPLAQLTEINYVRGPQVIKSEDTFLTGYVVFDMKPGKAEVDVVRDAQVYLRGKIDSGEFQLPAGVSYTFAGSYENQVRSEKKLQLILPLALFIIFMILYFQFRSVSTSALVFSGILVAWAGGFILIWFYGL